MRHKIFRESIGKVLTKGRIENQNLDVPNERRKFLTKLIRFAFVTVASAWFLPVTAETAQRAPTGGGNRMPPPSGGVGGQSGFKQYSPGTSTGTTPPRTCPRCVRWVPVQPPKYCFNPSYSNLPECLVKRRECRAWENVPC